METVNDINDAIKKVQPLLEKITQIAENLERLSNNLSDPKGDLNRILSNAQIITKTLSSKKSFLEMAVADEESVQSIYEALKKVKDIVTKIDKMANKRDEQSMEKWTSNIIKYQILPDLQKRIKP